MCVACREMKEKEELFRIVKPADDAAFYDISGTADGVSIFFSSIFTPPPAERQTPWECCAAR